MLLSLICQDPQDARDVLEFLNQFLVVIYLGPYTHLFIILVYRLSICAIISKTCCCYLGSVTITRFQSAVLSVVDTGCRLNGPPEPIQTHPTPPLYAPPQHLLCLTSLGAESTVLPVRWPLFCWHFMSLQQFGLSNLDFHAHLLYLSRLLPSHI